MGVIVANEFVTLDGVIQAPGGSEEDAEDGFAFGGWQMPYLGEEFGELETVNYAGVDALLIGRKTYDIFASYWPQASNSFSDFMNDTPKYVASRTMTRADWNNSTVLTGDLRDAIAQLKDQYERVLMFGSSGLFQSLAQQGLVDQLDLWVYPVVLGSGKRLFADGSLPVALHLADSRTLANGSVFLRYEKAGDVRLP
jgi:dihydrofolate reductase